MELFDKIDTSVIAAFIAMIATLLSAFISTYIKRLTKIEFKGIEIELTNKERDPIHDSRIKDITEVLNRQEVNAKWYSRADGRRKSHRRDCQEHHRIRRVHRFGRHGRLVAYHRYVLGPGQPSVGNVRHRRHGQGDGLEI